MRILYEDRSLIAVYKEPGLAVQTKKVTEKDLESILLTYLAGGQRGSGRPELYVIHRIDQPVDGIVLFAKNKKAAADLARQLTDGSMKKIYRAEVAGTIPSESGILEDFLVKDGRRNMSSVVQDPKSNPGAKRAKLLYRKIGENSLEIELFGTASSDPGAAGACRYAHRRGSEVWRSAGRETDAYRVSSQFHKS